MGNRYVRESFMTIKKPAFIKGVTVGELIHSALPVFSFKCISTLFIRVLLIDARSQADC